MCQLGCISIRLGEPQYLPELVMAGLDATNHSTDIDKWGLTVSLLSLPVSALTCGDHGWPPAWPAGQEEIKLKYKSRGGEVFLSR